MPNVLFIVPHLSNSTRLLADYLRYLDRSFHVTLFALEPELALDGEFPPEARRIILKRGNRYLKLPGAMYQLLRAVKDQDLIVSWVELTPTYWASVIARLRGKPIIGWIHTHVGTIFDLGMRPGKLHTPFVRFFYPRLDVTVGCSDGVTDDFRERFGLTNATSIPNGIDLKRVRAMAEKPLAAEHERIFSKPTIAFVATLHPLKNPDLVIRMHAELRKRGIDHHLLMAGIGHLREELEALVGELGVRDTVFFTGFVQNPYPLIKRSTLFLLFSKLEGLPLVLAEALALGVPVVAADCPVGPREVLHGGKYGTLVPPGELQPLIDTVASLLTDPQKLATQRQAALLGGERHSIVPRTRQMEELFRRVIAGHAAASRRPDELARFAPPSQAVEKQV